MSAYPKLKRFGTWLGSQLIPGAILIGVGYALGFDRGQDVGRLEMKCAIFAVVERLGTPEPAPGTITLGCEKVRPTKPASAVAA